MENCNKKVLHKLYQSNHTKVSGALVLLKYAYIHIIKYQIFLLTLETKYFLKIIQKIWLL